MTRKPAFALATILVLLGVSMFALTAVISIANLESRISQSNINGVQAYFAAESIAQQAGWRLQRDTTLVSISGVTATMESHLFSNRLDNYSYTLTNMPVTGVSAQVTFDQSQAYRVTTDINTTLAQATTGSSRRRVLVQYYKTPATPLSGTNGIAAGGSVTVSNGGATLTITSGDFFTNGALSVNNARVNLGSNKFRSVGTYSQGSGGSPGSNPPTLISGGVESSNYAPTPTAVTIPTYDFAGARSAAIAAGNYYTPDQFMRFVATGSKTGSSTCSGTTRTVTLPGPVTYIDGSVTSSNCFRNKTFSVTGELVVSGSLSILNNSSSFTYNGSLSAAGKGGIITSGSMTLSGGTYSVAGVLYSGGSFTISNNPSFTISGAIVAVGAVSISNGSNTTINYTSGPVISTLGGNPSTPITTEYWEEEY